MANSHKFVLNMSSIDWSCQMNTIKEMALSATHLGGEDGGIKRGGMVEAKHGQGEWENRPAEEFLATVCRSSCNLSTCVYKYVWMFS